MKKKIEGGKKIIKDCPVHGNTDKAKELFWKNPLTCHWQCKCKGIKRLKNL